jgi:RecB family exonuclease
LVSNKPRRGSVLPWSYSSLNSYEQCPRRFYLTRITKQVVEPQTEATLHGNEVHRAMEKAVGGEKALPEKFSKYQGIVDKLRQATGKKLLEYKFGFDSSLNPVEFFGNGVWCRGVLDVGIVRQDDAIVLDYKTGKRKLDGDQLRLFSLAALSLWPHVNRVKTGYIWLQSSSMDQEVFERSQKTEIHQEFAARVHRMVHSEKTDDWPARPSGLCKAWCPVGRSLCEHCGK